MDDIISGITMIRSATFSNNTVYEASSVDDCFEVVISNPLWLFNVPLGIQKSLKKSLAIRGRRLAARELETALWKKPCRLTRDVCKPNVCYAPRRPNLKIIPHIVALPILAPEG